MDQQGTENAIALPAETAVDEKPLTRDKKKGRKKRRLVHRVRGRWSGMSPEEREWMVWNHDLDTILHAIVQSPASLAMTPKELVARAEAFADELHELQKRRKPEGVKYNGRGF